MAESNKGRQFTIRPVQVTVWPVMVVLATMLLGSCAMTGEVRSGDGAGVAAEEGSPGADPEGDGGAGQPGAGQPGAGKHPGAGHPEAGDSTGAPVKKEYPVAPFDKETLYQLLVAEVAGYRNQYDVALENYVDLTLRTRDPGVAARATRLAAYLKRDEITLQVARIWASVDPEDVEAHSYAADQLVRAGDLEAAVDHMEMVKRLGGLANFQQVAFRAASMDRDTRAGLLTTIGELLSRYPADSQLLFTKAVLLEQNGDPAAALVITQQLLPDKKDTNVIILHVNALRKLDRVEEGIELLDEETRARPAQRRLRLYFARLLFEQEELDKAREQYQAILERYPRDGDILFALALIAMEQEEDQVATEYFKKMVKWNRRAGEAHYYLGAILEKAGDLENAIGEYEQVSAGYELVPAHSRIAELIAKDGRVADARLHLESARAEFPERWQDLILVEARLLTDYASPAEVFALLDHSLTVSPDNTDLLYYRAMAGERFGDLDILERDLRRIIELDPDNADALNALGYTLTDKTDRHEEALVLITKALEIKPDEAAFIDSMGWVMYRLANYDEAIKHLRQALDMFPNDEVAAHLGEVLWVTGQKAEARKVWDEALELTPDSKILHDVMNRLTE